MSSSIPMRYWAHVARQAEVVLEASRAVDTLETDDDAVVDLLVRRESNAERELGRLLAALGYWTQSTLPLLRLVDGRLLVMHLEERGCRRRGTHHLRARVEELPEIVDLQRAAEASGRGRSKDAQPVMCHQRKDGQ